MAQAAVRLRKEGERPDPMRFRFTKRELDRIEPGEGQRWVYDEAVKGLAMVTTPAGHKTFYLAKRFEGRYRRVKLGSFPEVSVEQARKAALRKLNQEADGKNPAEERQQARAAMVLSDLFDLYLTRHAQVHKRSWREDQRQYDKHLKRWAGRRLDSIKRADVAAWHARIGKTAPVAANRAMALLSTMYGVAEQFGYSGENPCRGVKRFTEQKRSRYLDAGELRRFLLALKRDPSELAKHAIWLMLLTAQRREPVLSMRWQDIDFKRKVWTIERTKAGRSHEVPLTGLALAILRRRQAKAGDDDVYVLTANTRLGHFSDPIPAVKRVCKAAEIPGRFTPHDVRRTWASWAVAAGVPHNVIQRALDHTPSDITSAIYAHVGIEQIRAGFEKTQRAMLTAKGGE